MSEGSVDIDTGNMPQGQSDTSDEVEEVGEETSQEETPKEVEESSSEQSKEEVELTEKGTKLDPNPQSAAYQQLANERRLRQQYEQVLRDPGLLKKYAQESGMTLAEAKEEVKEDLYSVDKLKTAEDVANALNEIKTGFTKNLSNLQEENQRLKSELTGLSSSRQFEYVANNMQKDISTVREKYPELNPKSSEFDPELEREIGSFYHELDYDPQLGGYRGNYSIAKITDRIMKAAGRARDKGAKKAQTIVKQKEAGKVVTSSKASSKSESVSTDPATAIAQRIRKITSG
jgi:hypothetical protein